MRTPIDIKREIEATTHELRVTEERLGLSGHVIMSPRSRKVATILWTVSILTCLCLLLCLTNAQNLPDVFGLAMVISALCALLTSLVKLVQYVMSWGGQSPGDALEREQLIRERERLRTLSVHLQEEHLSRVHVFKEEGHIIPGQLSMTLNDVDSGALTQSSTNNET